MSSQNPNAHRGRKLPPFTDEERDPGVIGAIDIATQIQVQKLQQAQLADQRRREALENQEPAHFALIPPIQLESDTFDGVVIQKEEKDQTSSISKEL
ncbi:hypothetical protein BATDEDRAFT_87907 [Batrachochytrium dendrobatidis JAM81]|uniref:Uncharacterized protein n=1 Tax=Batrachochytrium dendrobatidis (strain JAM81 / FGSC 10211) TaxID=684364 RepID=F4P0R1_BATDJ|nr:uncharacterized protein BATDEDRAFT_87907 [Batrachochytrium dendrobatidis JAM81]EGF81323.1 hypothetical protein BATDEDRAFT_87907 [Batrachochytrium dendrobatidis JAM81]KAK5669515.1 hypothetical protein QVD99_003909 [Batrachochytrium dendrobatidis]|eukprot:XP_006678170.1 hypothetical protein BATDEDRAFT_87907 [Batrachochytrium dendrobatidis JAM81]